MGNTEQARRGGVNGEFSASGGHPIDDDMPAEIASKKGVPLSDLANELLKREIEIIEAVK